MDAFNEDKLLRGATSWQKRPGQSSAVQLGNVAHGYLLQHASEFKRNAAVMDVWQQILPEGLKVCSHVERIEKGTLTVQVDPGPFMHELKLMSQDLLTYIQQQCPYCGVRRIRLVPRKTTTMKMEDNI